MNNKRNLILFLIVLAIPFALSSQTRKAIPAGRFEALSGIKTSGPKNISEKTTSVHNLIIEELEKNLPTDRREYFYYKNSQYDFNFNILIPQKDFKESIGAEKNVDFLITDNLKKDSEKLRYLTKSGLILFISSQDLKENMMLISPYELILYQVSGKDNFYLLKNRLK